MVIGTNSLRTLVSKLSRTQRGNLKDYLEAAKGKMVLLILPPSAQPFTTEPSLCRFRGLQNSLKHKTLHLQYILKHNTNQNTLHSEATIGADSFIKMPKAPSLSCCNVSFTPIIHVCNVTTHTNTHTERAGGACIMMRKVKIKVFPTQSFPILGRAVLISGS